MKRLSWLGLFFLIIISCKENTTKVETGTVLVKVVDLDGTLMANETITLKQENSESGLVKKTDKEGICRFNVKPGKYYVNAHLPGPGPSGKFYHTLVIVKENEMSQITLEACRECYKIQ